MRGLLFSQMVPPDELLDEFHDWYDTEHVPNRLVLPGFASATRAEAAGDETRYLVTYELSDMAVLDTPEYDELKRNPGERTERMLGAVHDFTRYIAETIWSNDGWSSAPGPAAAALLVVHAVDAPELDGPGTQRIVDAIESVPGRPAGSRTQLHRTIGASVGPARTHLVVHELGDTPSDSEHDWLDAVAVAIADAAGSACETLRYVPFRYAHSDWT